MIETIIPSLPDVKPQCVRVTDRHPATVYSSLSLTKDFVTPGDIVVSAGSGLHLAFEKWLQQRGARVAIVDPSLALRETTHTVLIQGGVDAQKAATFTLKNPHHTYDDTDFVKLQKKRWETVQKTCFLVCMQMLPSVDFSQSLSNVQWFLDSYGPSHYIDDIEDMADYIQQAASTLSTDGSALFFPISNRPEFWSESLTKTNGLKCTYFSPFAQSVEGSDSLGLRVRRQ